MYAALNFPIPTPAPHMTLGELGMRPDQSGADYMPWRGFPHPLPPVRISPPVAVAPAAPVPAAAPTSAAEASFVPVSGGWLNLNTGQIVDAETMQNIANAASTNPSILSAPVASLPANVLSSAVKAQFQSGTLPTAQSTGITSGGSTSWWTQTTNLFGMTIPNWGFVVGAGGLFLLISGGGRRGRR